MMHVFLAVKSILIYKKFNNNLLALVLV